MSRLWKDFRTNLMYWRFRHITRNRLRLRNWWMARQRKSPRSPFNGKRVASPYRERGAASYVTYRNSRRRSWIALAVIVIGLTALSTASGRWQVNGALIYALESLVVVGAIYWALRGV